MIISISFWLNNNKGNDLIVTLMIVLLVLLLVMSLVKMMLLIGRGMLDL